MRIVAAVLLLGGMVAAQQISCPMHEPKLKNRAEVEIHGDAAMGFPHDKTTHHFRLATDGGAIEVTATDAKDREDIEAIRMHLRHIASMFADGNFSIPMLVHSQTLPGVTEMTYRRRDIAYAFEESPTGGRVRIKTTNQDALNAVHDFLIYQIRDHETGDAEHP